MGILTPKIFVFFETQIEVYVVFLFAKPSNPISLYPALMLCCFYVGKQGEGKEC